MLQKIYSKVCTFLETQLFIGVFCMPILIAWGIPISKMTIIGNLIFSPVITIFLFLSFLIAITEIFYIPNMLLIKLLDKISNVWLKVISWGQKSWLLGIKTELLYLTIIFFLISIASLIFIKKKETRIAILIILTLIPVFTNLIIPKTKQFQICLNKKSFIDVATKNSKNFLKDQNCLKKASLSFIRYTLIPEIIKNSGSNKIDEIEIEEMTPEVYKALKMASSFIKIKEIRVIKYKKGDYYKIKSIKTNNH